jgi:hypothetical protein
MKKLALVLLLAMFASPAFSNAWTLDEEQCIVTMPIALNSKPAVVIYTSVNDHAMFVVSSPGWGLPPFNEIEGVTVEHQAGVTSTGTLFQRDANTVAIVWERTEAFDKSLNENATAMFRVMLPGDKELMSFIPNLVSTHARVRECVVKQNTV